MQLPNRLIVLVVCIVGILASSVFAQQLKAVINVPVADQRANQTLQAVNFGEDKDENTQLLYMESVLVTQQAGEWSWVEAVAQKIYDNGTWIAYPGWVLTSQLTIVSAYPTYQLVVTDNWAPIFARSCSLYGCLPSDVFVKVSIGTYLLSPQSAPANGFWPVTLHNGQTGFISASLVIPLAQWNKKTPEATLRSQVVTTAQKLLGRYYFWGGRSAFNDEMWSSQTQLTGVDCSGFVSLSHKLIGKILPRNANDIFLGSKNVTNGPTGLQPGDVLFLAFPTNPNWMYHVMMVLDENFIMESNYDKPDTSYTLPHQFTPVNNNGTRMVSYTQKFGVPLSSLRFGQQVPYQSSYLYWGTYF